jgi:hypothetical protein
MYICNDSTQNHKRKANEKKEKDQGGKQSDEPKNKRHSPLATYDCGGIINITFSTKNNSINVIYKHNPIHRDVESRLAGSPGYNAQLFACFDN